MGFWLCSNSLVGSQITQEVKIICTQPRAHLFLDLIDARKHTHTTNFVSFFFPLAICASLCWLCLRISLRDNSLALSRLCVSQDEGPTTPYFHKCSQSTKTPCSATYHDGQVVPWTCWDPTGRLSDWVKIPKFFFLVFFPFVFLVGFFFANAPFCLIDLVFYLFINLYVLGFFCLGIRWKRIFCKDQLFCCSFLDVMGWKEEEKNDRLMMLKACIPSTRVQTKCYS